MMTDPIADMLTRIRNANRIERPAVEMPATKLKRNIAQVLKDEGFILDYVVGTYGRDEAGNRVFVPQDSIGARSILRIYLKYGPEGEKVIRHLERVSRPGRRLYRRRAQIRPVLDGLGIAILSTNKGVMSDRQARAQGLGGEWLCTVW
ncbi:MAG: 30S ribosomal protein S8 [Gemmataceae bacterium]|nr:30S ribosomal protein S8 [Gemmataceae bacterium]MDW8264473.1 30S ribosomal protein S8 [Gemmataceae bacterium]